MRSKAPKGINARNGRLLWQIDPVPATSLTARNAAGGANVWLVMAIDSERQLVYHDIWDYDTPPQSTLTDIDHSGEFIPALVQPTKQGSARRHARRMVRTDPGARPAAGADRAQPPHARPGQHLCFGTAPSDEIVAYALPTK